MTGIVMDRYRYVPPLAASFSTIVGTNSENPTVTDTTGRGLNIAFGTNPAASDNIRGCYKSLNAASSQSIIARFEFMSYGWNFTCSGLSFTDGTKFVTFAQAWFGTPSYQVDYWTNSTTNSSEPFNSKSSNDSTGAMEWMRVDVVSGVPTNYFVGPNGTDWLELYSASSSGFMSTPTKVGFFMDVHRSAGSYPVVSTQQMFLNVLYYSDPDIVPGV